VSACPSLFPRDPRPSCRAARRRPGVRRRHGYVALRARQPVHRVLRRAEPVAPRAGLAAALGGLPEAEVLLRARVLALLTDLLRFERGELTTALRDYEHTTQLDPSVLRPHPGRRELTGRHEPARLGAGSDAAARGRGGGVGRLDGHGWGDWDILARFGTMLRRRSPRAATGLYRVQRSLCSHRLAASARSLASLLGSLTLQLS
jgi:hypothetical protein